MQKEIITYDDFQLTAAGKSLQSCPTLCDPIDHSPPRLPCPWDSPGKNTGVGCHFLLQCMKVKSESAVAQSCPTLSNPYFNFLKYYTQYLHTVNGTTYIIQPYF